MIDFHTAVVLAVAFWGSPERDVHIKCWPVHEVQMSSAQLAVLTGVPDSDMAADIDTCGIIISIDPERSKSPVLYAAEIAHEVGHLSGLDHSASGVMSASTAAFEPPWYCWHLKWSVKHGVH